MYTSIKNIIVFLAVITSLSATPVTADGMSTGLKREIVAAEALANVPGHELTAVTLEIEPGVVSPSHRHAGFVFVYVLEGVVRSQLNHAEIIEYKVGESWVEPPGTVHSRSENPSKTDKAKILAVFIAKAEAQLTTPEKTAQ